jgi:hypothetical protein
MAFVFSERNAKDAKQQDPTRKYDEEITIAVRESNPSLYVILNVFVEVLLIAQNKEPIIIRSLISFEMTNVLLFSLYNGFCIFRAECKGCEATRSDEEV